MGERRYCLITFTGVINGLQPAEEKGYIFIEIVSENEFQSECESEFERANVRQNERQKERKMREKVPIQ